VADGKIDGELHEPTSEQILERMIQIGN